MNFNLPKGKAKDFILNANARINIAHGSVRSSKTINSVLRFLRFIKETPSGNLLLTGRTERTIIRNLIDPMTELIGSTNVVLRRGVGDVTIYGRSCYIQGANDESSETKIRGLTLVGALADEVTTFPESFWKMLLSRLSETGAKVFATTNTDSPFHWLKRDYLDRADELDLTSYAFTLDDNPNLDPAFVASLKREYVGLWYRRFIDGEWCLAEGAVYDQFDDRAVVPSVVPPVVRAHNLVGIDVGYRNPCVFLNVAYDDSTDLHVTKEYYYDSVSRGRQKTDDEYVDDFVKWLDGSTPDAIYVDPSATSFILALKKRGYKISLAVNDVLDGIQCVGRYLSNDNLHIYKSCKNLIEEFASYIWDAKAQLRGEDKPIKQHDHALDALRYILYSHFGVVKRRISIGGR